MQDKMKGFRLLTWEARPGTAPNPGIVAAFGAGSQTSSRGSVGALANRPPLAVCQTPPATRPHTAKGILSSSPKTARVWYCEPSTFSVWTLVGVVFLVL